MSLKLELVTLAKRPDANLRRICRGFGVSPKTAYKWIDRFDHGGVAALADRPRRPHRSPARTDEAIERLVCRMRREHPAWGGRKIRHRLLALGHRACDVPAASTVTDVLRRHGLIDPADSAGHAPWVRFEHEHPNDLWQMDFLGDFATDAGGRCHSLSVLDDHSRFCVGLRACGDQSTATVRAYLTDRFRRYGLPLRILTDNGGPWGCAGADRREHRYTRLSAWLIRLGVGVSHGRPYHPQTQGKDERFHRTLRAEAIGTRRFADLADVQRRYDPWRDVYNLERPHEALGMGTPAARYAPSPRSFPEALPPIEYAPGDVLRKPNKDGYLRYRNAGYKISQAFAGQPVALRPTDRDHILDVFYCHQKVASLDLKRQTRI
jgi:transposase InsO family protein